MRALLKRFDELNSSKGIQVFVSKLFCNKFNPQSCVVERSDCFVRANRRRKNNIRKGQEIQRYLKVSFLEGHEIALLPLKVEISRHLFYNFGRSVSL